MASSKGSFAISEKFWIIILFFSLLAMLAVWLLLNEAFIDFVSQSINSEKTFCETFETNPVLGTLACPK